MVFGAYMWSILQLSSCNFQVHDSAKPFLCLYHFIYAGGITVLHKEEERQEGQEGETGRAV